MHRYRAGPNKAYAVVADYRTIWCSASGTRTVVDSHFSRICSSMILDSIYHTPTSFSRTNCGAGNENVPQKIILRYGRQCFDSRHFRQKILLSESCLLTADQLNRWQGKPPLTPHHFRLESLWRNSRSGNESHLSFCAVGLVEFIHMVDA